MEVRGEAQPSRYHGDTMDPQTILMIFVGVAIDVIYLISLLLIVIRRAKKLL